MNIVIASNKRWHSKMAESISAKANCTVVSIREKDELNEENVRRIAPRYIFFPHWSYKIPKEIHDNYECIIFHMTDVPYGRGGSPLQNLIARGIYETKISALRCEEELDSGAVYLKRPLSLYGTAEEIFIRSSSIVEEMIMEILQGDIKPQEQSGTATFFKRRKPKEGNIASLNDLNEVFDYIRMLDAEGYPRAFIETEHFIFEFERASLKADHIIADVKIKRKQ